jgi:hypothetical protein
LALRLSTFPHTRVPTANALVYRRVCTDYPQGVHTGGWTVGVCVGRLLTLAGRLARIWLDMRAAPCCNREPLRCKFSPTEEELEVSITSGAGEDRPGLHPEDEAGFKPGGRRDCQHDSDWLIGPWMVSGEEGAPVWPGVEYSRNMEDNRWSVLRYAIGSWSTALRLCLIMAVLALLVRLIPGRLL